MAACECGENLLTKIFIGEYHDIYRGLPFSDMAKHSREFGQLWPFGIRAYRAARFGKNRIREQYIFTGWWFGCHLDYFPINIGNLRMIGQNIWTLDFKPFNFPQKETLYLLDGGLEHLDYFPINIGNLIIPIDGPYFSEGWPNHQPV